MPLEFESMSHGKIAFGFFNIETDMLLLNDYLLFARDFCHDMIQAAENNHDVYEASWEVYQIENGADIGNLMGAIYGIDHRGFIGDVYKLFPFPREREKFKQKLEGFKSRPQIEKLIQKYGKRITISFVINQREDKVSIGEYVWKLSPARRSFPEMKHRSILCPLPSPILSQDERGTLPASRAAFQELIKYVWVGGFPRWKDEIRPDYVMAMKKKIEQSNNRLFNDLRLE